MKTMGFINSHKENEKRIAVLPKDLEGLSEISTVLFLEKGYGSNLGILDEDYRAVGAQIQSRNYILETRYYLRCQGRRRRIYAGSRGGENHLWMGASACL